MGHYFVYALVDPRTNTPFYVGKGSGNRPQDHLNETIETTINIRKYHKIQSIRDAGYEPKIEIWHADLSEEDAFDLEESEIKRLGRKGIDVDGILMNLLVDARPPNRQGRPHSPETREKMSRAAAGKKHSPEHRRNNSLSKSGKLHYNWGQSLSEETKAKIRDSNLGQKRSKKTRAAIAKSHAVDYLVTSPEGKEYRLNSIGLQKLCDQNGFNKTAMVNACRASKPYKGWCILRISPKPV